MIDVETETAGVYEAVTEAELHRLVQLMNPSNRYVILHRRDDPTAGAQAHVRADGAAYDVEYLDETGDWQTTAVRSADRVHELLAAWAFDRPGWKESARWKTVTQMAVALRANCEFFEEGGAWTARFEPLGVEGEGPTADAAYDALKAALFARTDAQTGSPEARAIFSSWAADHLVPYRADADVPTGSA